MMIIDFHNWCQHHYRTEYWRAWCGQGNPSPCSQPLVHMCGFWSNFGRSKFTIIKLWQNLRNLQFYESKFAPSKPKLLQKVHIREQGGPWEWSLLALSLGRQSFHSPFPHKSFHNHQHCRRQHPPSPHGHHSPPWRVELTMLPPRDPCPGGSRSTLWLSSRYLPHHLWLGLQYFLKFQTLSLSCAIGHIIRIKVEITRSTIIIATHHRTDLEDFYSPLLTPRLASPCCSSRDDSAKQSYWFHCKRIWLLIKEKTFF